MDVLVMACHVVLGEVISQILQSSDISSPMYNGVPAIKSDSPVYYRLVT